MDTIELATQPTPRERLELTRNALARQLARRRRPGLPAEDPELAQQQGMVPRMRRAARVWWHSHPIHNAVDFARPALQDYADDKPYRLVGMAAGAGAALALLRVWHLLPLTGVAFALMKSSDLKATARSFVATPLSGDNDPREGEIPRTAAAVASGPRADAA
ncbi:hypothetical protein [Pseudorhodoferax sp. Leaf274]|uniref:hypothetical protein n=1 Tax=Pseudorhodoferax sp. Leaf274 TaxID=1736318 RepID=UPI000702420B|nr:hypothetical protein [Pseudorhodoferax sp. Leaf274]KQP37426.1 hypothetical protein ASF44_13795 [Pseudorhodoferax sp. Leaf274]